MDDALERRLRELVDRQEILDALYRYSRGLDRADHALAASAYHDDAVDDHGAVVASGRELVDWAIAMHEEKDISHCHVLGGNVTIDLDGDTAHVESYFFTFCREKKKPNMLSTGRYVDRFERRDGKWAIAARVCVAGAMYKIEDYEFAPGYWDVINPDSRGRDISYERPLTINKPRRSFSTTIGGSE